MTSSLIHRGSPLRSGALRSCSNPDLSLLRHCLPTVCGTLNTYQASRILIIDRDLMNYVDKLVLCQSNFFCIQLLYNERLQQPKM